MKGSIEINGLRMYARHGVAKQELIVGNLFEVSVSLDYPFEKAMEHDSIAETLNYAEAVDVIKGIMSVPSRTLENVVWRLRAALVERFHLIEGGTIRISKITPPISVELRDVAVKITW